MSILLELLTKFGKYEEHNTPACVIMFRLSMFERLLFRILNCVHKFLVQSVETVVACNKSFEETTVIPHVKKSNVTPHVNYKCKTRSAHEF